MGHASASGALANLVREFARDGATAVGFTDSALIRSDVGFQAPTLAFFGNAGAGIRVLRKGNFTVGDSLGHSSHPLRHNSPPPHLRVDVILVGTAPAPHCAKPTSN